MSFFVNPSIQLKYSNQETCLIITRYALMNKRSFTNQPKTNSLTRSIYTKPKPQIASRREKDTSLLADGLASCTPQYPAHTYVAKITSQIQQNDYRNSQN